MKLEKTVLDDHQAQIVVEVEAERVQSARQRAARKLASRGKIPGFRPGKAPYDVIVRYYGDEAIYEQAVDLLVDEVYPQMLKEAEINPAAAGLLEKVEGVDHPTFTFKVPLSPEVQVGSYREIRLPYELPAPGPEKLDQALDELRRAYATTETVERPIEMGDYVVLDLASETKGLDRSAFTTVIQEGARADEFPFSGFAALLVGLKTGDVKSVTHKYPDEPVDAAFAGQDVQMQATITAVRSMTLPSLDDEFAKTVGAYDSLDALKEALKKEIEARSKADYDDEYYAKLVDQVRQQAVIKYAPQTLDHEAQHVVDDMRQRLAQQGLDLDTYYKMRKTDAAKFLEEEAKPVAKKRLERSLILDEVSRLEKIEVDNSSLDEEFNNTLVDLQTQGVNLGSIRGGKQGQQRVAEALAMQSANRLLTRRTLERLRAIANGENAPEPVAEPAGEVKQAAQPEKAGKGSRAKASKKPGSARGVKTKAKKSVAKK